MVGPRADSGRLCPYVDLLILLNWLQNLDELMASHGKYPDYQTLEKGNTEPKPSAGKETILQLLQLLVSTLLLAKVGFHFVRVHYASASQRNPKIWQ